MFWLQIETFWVILAIQNRVSENNKKMKRAYILFIDFILLNQWCNMPYLHQINDYYGEWMKERTYKGEEEKNLNEEVDQGRG